MRKLIERRPKGSLPKWADGMPLHEHLNVPLAEIASSEPQDLELVQGMLTLTSLGKHAGRSLVHYWRGDYTGAPCGKKISFAARRCRTQDPTEVTCIRCLAWLREDAAMCCRCKVEFICGCRCKCHKQEAKQ